MSASKDVLMTYLQALPVADRQVLASLREQILALLPTASEQLSRGVPFFYYLGRRAVGFRASKTHLSFFIMEGQVMHRLKHEFERYDYGSTVIRFTAQNPLPADLINTLVLARKAEIEQSDKK